MAAEGAGGVASDLLIQDGQAILAALPATGDQNEAIHAARKAIRRMRALLALLEHQDAFDLERDDLALRRLGKGLSDLRDAHVVVETALRLQRHDPVPGWKVVLAALTERRARVLHRALERDPGFGRRRKIVERVLSSVRAQPWQRLRNAAIRDALKRSERRVKKAAARAARDGDAETVHRWRRRVRRLRMQLEVVGAFGAAQVHAHDHSGVVKKAKALHRTSDQLGRLQDLQLLRNLIRAMPAADGKAGVLHQIGDELKSLKP